MALLSKTSIYIKGELVPSFKQLHLDQRIDAHHTLEVVFRMETFEKKSKELGEKSKEFLGERMAVEIACVSEKSKHGTLEFKGVITEVNISRGSDSSLGDEITVVAKSTTFLADDGPHYTSFNEVRLSDVVSQVFNPYKIDHLIKPRYTEAIHYCVQQNESNYAFVSRLAAQFGEWFYYNGSKVVFGAPETGTTELKLNKDLSEYSLSLAPRSINYTFYTNDYLTDTIAEDDKNNKPATVSAFDGFVYDKSKKLFANTTKVWNNNNGPVAKRQLTAKAKAQQEAIAINQVRLQGASENPGVKLGNILTIEDEKYRVISVAHSATGGGDYENRFEAVSGSFNAYPNTDINAFPRSDAQTAKVMENHDPDKMGRIKVQFPWQKTENKMTPWIRMASSHAGGGKGFFFIPEKGEEVIVDFEGGNAETPIVTGCLYHSNAEAPEAGSNANNDIKILQTKSGCSLTFNDEEGSITLSDKGGSSITMDGKGAVSISGKKSVSVSGGSSVSLSAKNVSANGSEAANLTSDAKVSLGGDSVQINGTTTASVDSATVNVTGTTEATITGTAKATITSSGTTSVAGTIIKLN